jgi:hypothetical protein
MLCIPRSEFHSNPGSWPPKVLAKDAFKEEVYKVLLLTSVAKDAAQRNYLSSSDLWFIICHEA